MLDRIEDRDKIRVRIGIEIYDMIVVVAEGSKIQEIE